ncbi:MAG: MFS transporter [Alphaproteobacteria bacterium]|nr:MFS transporter [Alphaproteobacteria bacterium]
MIPSKAAGPGVVPEQTAQYPWYVLGLLTLVFAFGHMDRNIVAILLNSIATDLGLTDWEAGAISGLAFGLTYILLGIPLAWLADRSNRKRIISISLGLWSVMTALCGFTQTALQLFFARMGVGIGEAGCVPASQSIIADYFPKERRAFALGVFGLGIPIGTLAGFALGGLINDAYGWRHALIIVGGPGLIAAVILQLTLREPRRGLSDRVEPLGGYPPPPFSETILFLVRRRSLLHLVLGTSLIVFGGYGSQTWIPAFFERSHGLTSGEIGVMLGPSLIIGGVGGTLLGGLLADRLSAKDVRWYVWIPAIAMIPAIPVSALALLLPSTVYTIAGLPIHAYAIAIALMALPGAAYSCYLGPANAVLQLMVPLRMRATTVAIFLMITNLVGMGLGPVAVGAVSDFMNARFGQESLRYTMLSFLFIYAWAALHYYLAGRSLQQDLDAQYR